MSFPELEAQLKRQEGLRLKVYKCTAGYNTVGYGRNLDTRGISETEALAMLQSDIDDVEQKLEDAGLLKGLNDARACVLINMCFQMGISGLMRFKRTLQLIKDGLYEEAANEMLDSRWAMQTPSRARELSDQMRTGEFQ